ncbi:MAG: peptidase [Anderseniella sp.]|nr:peptidase [Anderseniella sp.]
MTYCVGLKLKRGLVMAADTRTNAGLDNISTFRKLQTFEVAGERIFIMMSAGNLAVTQAVVAILEEEFEHPDEDDENSSLKTVPTMFHAAKLVGETLKTVRQGHVDQGLSSDAFSASFIFGGQIGTEEPRLYQIYSEGNFIEAKDDTPFFQIGEHKYGKPILDRVANQEMRLGEAAKLVLLSFDSTIRSNLSVGMPIDMVVYNTDNLSIDRVRRIEQDDPYFRSISAKWSEALRTAVETIEEFDI